MTEADLIDWDGNPFPIGSPARLLTPRRFWAGEGHGLTRSARIASIVGVPWNQRVALNQWLTDQGLFVDPPTLGPWTDKPLAGCVDWDRLRTALQQAIAGPGLPFDALNLEPIP